MAINLINIGNVVNDGLGDDLRTAFQKVNANFSELESNLTITASNIGTTGARVFKQKINNNLEFRNIVSGTKILINEGDNGIVVNNTAPDAFTRIDTNAGNVLANSFQQITLQGGRDIDVTAFGSVITINNVPIANRTWTEILTYIDFGPVTGNFENAVQFAVANSNIDFGTINEPSRIDLDCGTIL